MGTQGERRLESVFLIHRTFSTLIAGQGHIHGVGSLQRRWAGPWLEAGLEGWSSC